MSELSATPHSTPAACDHPKFALYRKSNGQWAAKIKGKHRYFGSIEADPTGVRAWERYKQELPFWQAGMDPRKMAQANQPSEQVLSLTEISNRWLVYRRSLVKHADKDLAIQDRTYDDSVSAVQALGLAMRKLGLRGNMDPLLWTAATWAKIRTLLGFVRRRTAIQGEEKSLSPATKGGRIVNIRMMFTWAKEDEKIIDRLPDWGTAFATVGEEAKEEYRYDYQREHGDRVFGLELARKILLTLDRAAERAGVYPNNTSGFRGVSQRPDGRFEAYIVLKRAGQKQKVHLGVFDTPEQAGEAYRRAALERGIDVEKRMAIGARLFRACSYLSANTGAYSKDIASLHHGDLVLADRYLERKRSKTNEFWQAILWPETVKAIQEYLEVRPQPDRSHRLYCEEWESLVFLSSTGLPVNMDEPINDDTGHYKHTVRKDILKVAMRKLLTDLGEKVPGVSFGAWRHTFESLASSAIGCAAEDLRKFDALNRTSARRIPGSRNRYVKLRPDQLKPITDVIREQLWPDRVHQEKHAAERAAAKTEAASTQFKSSAASSATIDVPYMRIVH